MKRLKDVPFNEFMTKCKEYSYFGSDVQTEKHFNELYECLKKQDSNILFNPLIIMLGSSFCTNEMFENLHSPGAGIGIITKTNNIFKIEDGYLLTQKTLIEDIEKSITPII